MAYEEDDDFDEDEDGEEMEQVCEVVCPHCKNALHVVVAPAGHAPGEGEDEDDDY